MKILVLTKRTLIIAAVVLLLLITVIILLLSFAPNAAAANSFRNVEEYELEVLAGKKRELPIYSVERSDKKIALTVDAAWEADKTDFILDTLDKYNMNQLSAADIRKELEKYDDTIEKLLGYRTKAFRCPYGEYNDNVITTVRDMGYEVWQWDIDTIDWREERSAQTILDTVIPKLHPGCVILCHNNGYKIKEYLPTLIETAQAQGYEFVTVSELRLEGDTVIDVNGTQKAA